MDTVDSVDTVSASDLDLETALRKLARHRAERDTAKARLAALRAAWESEHAILIDWAKKMDELVKSSEDEARKAGLGAYQAAGDGNKAVGFGVQIKAMTRLDYDQGQALQYAIDHRLFLALDKSAFERYVRNTPLPPPFVAFREELVATLPSDLQKLLDDSSTVAI